MLKFKIRTWKCQDCGFTIDCEPTQENMDRHFNASKRYPLVDIKAFQCPNPKCLKESALAECAVDDPKCAQMKIQEIGDEIDDKGTLATETLPDAELRSVIDSYAHPDDSVASVKKTELDVKLAI